MNAAALKEKLVTATSRITVPPAVLRATDRARGMYYDMQPAHRMVAGSVLAIVLVVGVAALSLSSGGGHKTVSVAAPALSTRIVLAAPQRPTAEAPAPAPAEPEAMSLPLADQLRTLQNTPVQLAPAPIEALMVATPQGNLPKIGPDGRLPWQAYARPTPVVPAGAPRLAVMLVDMGLSERLTTPALEQLPGQVTVALNGQSPKLEDYAKLSRERGHEVLLDVPAEPRFYPEEDPGPAALMTRIGNDENTRRLRTWLSKTPGAIGITTLGGTQYVTDAAAMTPVINELKLRGLAWIDGNAPRSVGTKLATTLQAATASVNIDLDSILTPSAIRAQFEKALDIARTHDSVLILARPYPLTVSLLNELLGNLPDAGIALVPASAMLVAPDAPAAPTAATAPAAQEHTTEAEPASPEESHEHE